MTGRKFLFIFCLFCLVEGAVLIFFDILGPYAGKESAILGKIGPFEFINHDMKLESFQEINQWRLTNTPADVPTFWAINSKTAIMMLVVDAFIIILAVLATKKITAVPSRMQSIFELVCDFFYSLVVQTLGEHGKRYVPFFGSVFLFLMISNCIVMLPFTSEPTRDLNVTVGQMIAVLCLVHGESIRVKGFGNYVKEYFQPFFIMFPLNVVGEIAKGVSLSFRLFGNILGGSIIIAVVSYLVKYTMVPVGLMLFFDLGVGIVQAFVFTMLGMTYLAVAIAEE